MAKIVVMVLLSLLGYSTFQMIVALLTGQTTLPGAGAPKIEEYELLKAEIERSSRFSPSGPASWRFLDRPATVTFEDKTYTVTLKGESVATGKPFQYRMSINQMTELRDLLARAPGKWIEDAEE